MLALTIFYDIPQLNVGMFFMMQADERTNDPEKVCLKTSNSLGSKYMQCHSSDTMISDKTASSSPGETTPIIRTHS